MGGNWKAFVQEQEQYAESLQGSEKENFLLALALAKANCNI